MGKKKPVTITRALIERIKVECKREAREEVLILFAAWMMEHPAFTNTDVQDMYDTIEKWLNAIDDKELDFKLNNVKQIIIEREERLHDDNVCDRRECCS